ncbi:LUD domain-containing protein [Kitasatospora sp. NPDC059673]|uniref:LUD domain-containing protein n=1 Tax=Kitasatospora sp. NPDC059673 TaxID=3346901 RepID=UPI0036CADA6B
MTTFQAIADRVEIQALQAEFTDAVTMRDRARLAALFTADGVLRMPNIPIELTGPEEIRLGGEKLQEQWVFFVQNTHPGAITIDGDTATGRAHMHEIARTRNGLEGLNYAIYHDRYRRTPDGWRFTERVYELRYLDTSPLTGSAPEQATEAPAARWTEPVGADRLERAADALAARGFAVEILADAEAARARVRELVPEKSGVFTTASETLRLSGIDEDLNSDRYPRAVKPRVLTMDRESEAEEIRHLLATPDVVIGSVAALTETGSLVVASGSGSQLPANTGGAGRAIWIIGAQKIVPDLPTALRRLEEHALPLESARTEAAYGMPSAVNQLVVFNAPTRFTDGIVLLVQEAIGY